MPESQEVPENRNILAQITVTASGVVSEAPTPIEGEQS